MLRAVLLVTVIALPSALALTVEPPDRDPVEATEAQTKLIREGIALHDEGKVTEALQRYEQVLAENPDCPEALYEAALTCYDTGKHEQALAHALQSVRYRSDILSHCYQVLGTTLDAMGRTGDAITVYELGIETFPDSGGLHFDLALTLHNQGELDRARAVCKRAAVLRPGHPTTHLLLGRIFSLQGYRIPAALAALRFVVLAPNPGSLAVGRKLLEQNLYRGVSEDRTEVQVNPNAPTDEGDFQTVELALSVLLAAQDVLEEESEDDDAVAPTATGIFLEALTAAPPEPDSTFALWFYVPYFLELREHDFAATLHHLVHRGEAAATSWLEANQVTAQKFFGWSRDYTWPTAPPAGEPPSEDD